MRGRKPVPSAIKKLTGNPGGRQIQHGPTPGGLPQCPEHLAPEAQAEWNRIVYELELVGLVSAIDRAALAAYCQAWSRWADAERNLQIEGVVLKSPNGYPIQNPYLAIANKAMEQMKMFLVEFGMTPSSRSRVEVKKHPDPENRFARLDRELRARGRAN